MALPCRKRAYVSIGLRPSALTWKHIEGKAQTNYRSQTARLESCLTTAGKAESNETGLLSKAVYLLPRVFELDDVNVHDFGATTSVGVSFSGARLFFVRSELKSTKSASS